MKGAIKFQATNTDHNHNPLQLSNRMGTEQGGKRNKNDGRFPTFLVL